MLKLVWFHRYVCIMPIGLGCLQYLFTAGVMSSAYFAFYAKLANTHTLVMRSYYNQVNWGGAPSIDVGLEGWNRSTAYIRTSEDTYTVILDLHIWYLFIRRPYLSQCSLVICLHWVVDNVSWFIHHLVCPAPGLPNTWFIQHLVYPASGLSSTWFTQHLVYPAPGLASTWLTLGAHGHEGLFIQHLFVLTGFTRNKPCQIHPVQL